MRWSVISSIFCGIIFSHVFLFCVCIGVLLGIAIRTGSPLSLYLAEPVWKQLAGMNLTIADLSEVSICVCVHTVNEIV